MFDVWQRALYCVHVIFPPFNDLHFLVGILYNNEYAYSSAVQNFTVLLLISLEMEHKL